MSKDRTTNKAKRRAKPVTWDNSKATPAKPLALTSLNKIPIERVQSMAEQLSKLTGWSVVWITNNLETSKIISLIKKHT